MLYLSWVGGVHYCWDPFFYRPRWLQSKLFDLRWPVENAFTEVFFFFLVSWRRSEMRSSFIQGLCFLKSLMMWLCALWFFNYKLNSSTATDLVRILRKSIPQSTRLWKSIPQPMHLLQPWMIWKNWSGIGVFRLRLLRPDSSSLRAKSRAFTLETTPSIFTPMSPCLVQPWLSPCLVQPWLMECGTLEKKILLKF